MHPAIEAAGFAERLQVLLQKHGHERRGAGAYLRRKYGVSSVTANAWLNGTHRAESDMARRIAADHDVSFEDLYFGEPATTAPEPFLSPIRVWSDPSDLPSDVFMFLPSLEYRWSCGNGGPDHNNVDATDRSLPFIAEWAKRRGWSVKTHFTMRTTGDSMEPTIQHGAPVVIDTSEAGRQIRSGRIYAIRIEGEPLLKRIDRLPGGKLRVRSDNPSAAYPPLDVEESQIEIVGRAVWTPLEL